MLFFEKGFEEINQGLLILIDIYFNPFRGCWHFKGFLSDLRISSGANNLKVFNPFWDWRENIYLIFFKNIKVKYVSLFEQKCEG